MTRASPAPARAGSTPEHPWLHARAIVLASAGTGKTYALSARYLRALLAPAPGPGASREGHEHRNPPGKPDVGHGPEPIGDPSALLATTFTRKAAGEILDRILKRLLEAESDPAKLARLRDDLRLDLSAADCRRAAATLARRLDRVRIMTIDSMMHRMARAAALTLDTAPGWTVADEADLRDLHSRAIHEALDEADSADTPRLAGVLRGSSRRPLSRQVFHALDRTVADGHRAFAESARDRALWSVVAPDTRPLDEARLAAAIAALERADLPATRSGDPNGHYVRALAACLRAIRENQWEAFACTGLVGACFDARPYQRIDVPPSLIDALAPLLDHARFHILTRLAERNLATADLLARYDAARRRLRDRTGLLSFTDITELLVEANVAGALDDLWYRLDGALHHLLIDEAQDTSLIQYRLIHPILSELLSADDHRGVLVVGDVKQSLYGWRQAEPELLPTIRDTQAALRLFPLAVSHRSSQVVLDAVNDLFGALTTNPALDPDAHPGAAEAAAAFQRDFHNHTAAPHADSPGLVLLMTHAWRDPHAARRSPDIERGAADAVQRLLRDALAAAPPPHAESTRRDTGDGVQAPLPDIAVLVRRNKFIRPIIAALRARGIDASEEGGAPLADDSAVAATLSLLHLADHPTDELARFHVAMSPLGIALGWNGVPSPASTRRRAARLRRALATRGYAHVLERLLDRAAAHIAPASAARMDQLLDLARAFDARASLRPSEFVSLVCEQRIARPAGARVRVMSIHAAKGLEFDAVVLPDLDAPSCPRGGCLAHRPGGPLGTPLALSLTVPREVARLHPTLADMHRQRERRLVFEDLCTLYVAMTRAKRALIMLIKPYSEAGEGELTLKAASTLRGCVEDWRSAAPESRPLRAWTRDAQPWWRAPGHDPERAAAARPATADPPPAELTLAPPRPGSLRRARIVAPSSLDGGPIDLADRLAPAGSAAGMDIGVIAHAILERLDWPGDAPPTEAALRAAASAVLAAAPRDADAAVNLVSRFLASPAAACLRRSWHTTHPGAAHAAPPAGGAPAPSLDLRREWAFLHEDPESDPPRLVSGAIDRLVLIRRGGAAIAADILDFKTDTIATAADLDARAAHYRPQLAAYRASIARMFNLDTRAVRATLVFLGAARLAHV